MEFIPHQSASRSPNRLPVEFTRSQVDKPAAKVGERAALAFDAAIFDMDGVITKTALVHSMAWKQMFDEYLRREAARRHQPFIEFTHAHDYLTYVDGRPRDEGVLAFLNSRGIRLPPGTPEDSPGKETVCGLGNRKNALFHEILASEGVELFETTIALIEQMRSCGIKVGLATSSQNCAAILKVTGIAPLFATVVDGTVSAKRGLKGKPAPDIFVQAATDLEVAPARAVVVEDAVTGVQAGVKGGFAFVIGVARETNGSELRDQGADLVVTDLGDTSVDAINALVAAKRAGW